MVCNFIFDCVTVKTENIFMAIFRNYMAFIFVWFLPTTGEVYLPFSRYGIHVFPAGVTIHIPCDLIQFRLLPFDFDYVDSIM